MNELIKITVGPTTRYVRNIKIEPKWPPGCWLVNDGRDDLYDLSFGHEDLGKYPMVIEYGKLSESSRE